MGSSARRDDLLPGPPEEGTPAEPALDNYARSRYLAENVLHLLDHDVRPGRSVIWGHLFHLGAGFNDPARGVRPNMGHYLRQRFGRGYYVCGLEFDRGAYLARRWPPGRSLGDLEVVTLPPAPRGSIPWHLARAGEHAGFPAGFPAGGTAGGSAGRLAQLIDLRTRPVAPAVRRWLATPAKAHTVSCTTGSRRGSAPIPPWGTAATG